MSTHTAPSSHSRPQAQRSKTAITTRWRQELWRDAVVAIALKGGEVLGSDLARILGVSPRGLFHVIRQDQHFVIRIRYTSRHDVMFIALNPRAIRPVGELPHLVREEQPALPYCPESDPVGT